mgnify:CR=1 FL=1
MPGVEELIYEVFLALGLALILGKLFEEVFVRLGAPPVIGDLVAGLILGKTLLGVYPVTDVVNVFSWFGITLLLFYAGLETRYREFMKHVPTYGLITVGEVFSAFLLGYIIGVCFGYTPLKAYFIGTILVATSVSLSVRTLIEIDKLTTIEGRTVLGIAVLDDLAALIIIVAGTSLATMGSFNIIELLRIAITAFTAWFLIVFSLHRLSSRLARYAIKLHVEESLFAIIFGIFALLAYLAKYIGISYLVMAYAVGLAFSEVRGVRRVAESVRALSIPFSTLFFMMTAATIDIRIVMNPNYVPFYIVMVATAFAGKILGGGLASYIMGYPLWSALRVAVGLFPRAEFCIIAAYLAVTKGILSYEAYLAALMIVLVTNFLTPPILKAVYLRGPEVTSIKPRWKFRKNIKSPVHR